MGEINIQARSKVGADGHSLGFVEKSRNAAVVLAKPHDFTPKEATNRGMNAPPFHIIILWLAEVGRFRTTQVHGRTVGGQ